MPDVRPLRICVPDEAVADLRARLTATRWMDDVFAGDWRCGAPVPFVRALCDHWLERFDWRGFEARLNREEHLTVEVDGITLHAMTRPSRHPGAIPLMLLHGWPSSFAEFLDLCEPLADPPPDMPAFHVVVPSLPGYGFSTTRRGLTPRAVAASMVALMRELGHDRFIVQGGDWGSLIATEIARHHPGHVSGLHLNLVSGGVPEDWRDYPLTEEERNWVETLAAHTSSPHLALQIRSPASLAHAQNDSPAGLAAWIGEKIHDWVDADGLAEPIVPYDRLLETIALYWFTGTAGSSALMYHDFAAVPWTGSYVGVPTAGAIFPKEVAKLPRIFAERLFNLVQWTRYPHGGHFPALEHPDWLIDDIRRFALILRQRVSRPQPDRIPCAPHAS